MEIALWLLGLIVALLLIAEVLVALIYLLAVIYRAAVKPGNIRKAMSLPDGEVFEKKNKSVTQACGYIEDIVSLFEETERSGTKYRTGANLRRRTDRTREVLNTRGLIRKLRFVDVSLCQTDKGKPFRKWDQGGKEWCAYEMQATAVEQYIRNGSELLTNYYPSVYVRFIISRRLTDKDKAASNTKDKWGRKVVKKDTFYEDMKLENCPSCGAKLPGDLKDIVCPYCNSTIFSDYYDWQVESLEIEPRKPLIRGIIGWIIHIWNEKHITSQVKNKKNAKIVRFYENDFRQDVYESFLESESSGDLIDMWLGTIEIRSITNTEKDTMLDISVPVYRIRTDGMGAIKCSISTEKARFVRARYPGRFRKDSAVISAEKQCPSCGAPFTPDDSGNCRYCGSFLYKDNITWKRTERT